MNKCVYDTLSREYARYIGWCYYAEKDPQLIPDDNMRKVILTFRNYISNKEGFVETNYHASYRLVNPKDDHDDPTTIKDYSYCVVGKFTDDKTITLRIEGRCDKPETYYANCSIKEKDDDKLIVLPKSFFSMPEEDLLYEFTKSVC